ncbi:hypothetical protein O2W14_13920 [Modestobacter sp. VKM Ac-2986]|uniref:hypothetical protein n=1 Tax=Modestobacter sp. VKM Ac-2986 TaxID=3004140 RepID=UPI0022AB9416|nr:hypothetical protein [Modestobacter sp. VKM Ac-2986]MCZ2829932.1 hypothetical protein [Modestobacter sp. VKM Ac-2986]
MPRSSLADLTKPTVSRTTALTMGLLTLSAGFAPAALAEETLAPESPAAPASTTPAEATVVAPEVLPPVPPTTAAAAEGPHYGYGKLHVALTASDDRGPSYVDPIGARIRVELPATGSAPAEDFTCVLDHWQGCYPDETAQDLSGYVDLDPDRPFTVSLVSPPLSGDVVMPDVIPSVSGRTGPIAGDSYGVDVELSAPGGHRTLGVALTGSGSLEGATFELHGQPEPELPTGPLLADLEDPDAEPVVPDELLATSSATDARGIATFPGHFAAGDYRVVQTGGPGGTDFDPTPVDLEVPIVTTLAERDTPVLAEVDGAVGPALPTQTTPAPAPAPAPTTSAPASTPAPVTRVVEKATLAQGATQTISLGGFQPFEMVHGVLYSTPVDLGTVQADAAGVATFTFAVPAGLETGEHSVTMTGLTSGFEAEATFTVTVAAAGSGLAYTGTEVLPLAATGGALLLAGAAALGLVRRRRTA